MSTNIYRPVTIVVGEIVLGTVEPPKVNGVPIYSEDFEGQRAVNGEWVNIHDVLGDLWYQWLKEAPHPDTDYEFIHFLAAKGWTEVTSPVVHRIEV
jgi:hypothetical protein